MVKLQTNLYYVKRCNNCGNDERYIMRSSNVNTNISDEDAIRMAGQYLGHVEAEHCENCHFYTNHTRVAYDLPAAKNE